MIYDEPAQDAAIDQGDLIADCPILMIKTFYPETGMPDEIEFGVRRVLVITQTCDFANEKWISAILVD